MESFNGKLRDELLDREVFNRILHTFGFANLPGSRHRDDGLTLHDAYITAALRCPPPANKPLREELANCKPYLLEELSLLANVRVVVALGKIAFDAYLGTCADRGPCCALTSAPLRAWSQLHVGGRNRADRVLSSEPAEHSDRPTHSRDV